MQVTSLGYRTDLIFHYFEGEVIDRGRYLVIRTPGNPNYYWGNFLIFGAPPEPGDFGRWNMLFEGEVGTPPHINHKVFTWNSVASRDAEIKDFLAAGFEFSESVVMSTETLVSPRRYNYETDIRALTTDADFAQHAELHVLSREKRHSETSYRAFVEANTRTYRKMIAAGLGEWFGAFLDGQLVADMGIFADNLRADGLARYQSVVTHPEFRRRGICSTLLYETGRFALSALEAKTLVIVADEHYFAKDIYSSVGFSVREKQGALERFP